jgi:hypothetical protein
MGRLGMSYTYPYRISQLRFGESENHGCCHPQSETRPCQLRAQSRYRFIPLPR